MHTKFIPASLLRVLMMVSVLCVPAALSQDIAQDDAQADATDTVANIATDDSTNYAKDMPAAYVTSSHQILAYNRAIKETESREGAYGSSLSESLLGLALILQSQGRHDEAIKLFKRGAHLARINEGLHCEQQLPFVRGEIASQKAQQNYAQADQRQNYLYHIQTKSIGSDAALADAHMEYAQWQYDVPIGAGGEELCAPDRHVGAVSPGIQ
ncbi:MAG: hypothetical protein IPG06_05890 [Haliea sp.]|nr:hypothetical protein [Haliea sp.]